jgi:small conductance mechanosensitive channel
MVDVEVSQNEDVERVMAVLTELGVEVAAAMDSVREPTEVLGVESMNPHSYVIRTLTRTEPGQQWAAARELRKRIILRFRQEGFDWPVPQRVVWNRALEPKEPA